MTDQELKVLLAQLALEADRRSAEADQRLARLEQSLAFTSAEADRRSAEADQRLAKLEHTLAQASAAADKRLHALSETLNGMGRSQGEAAEAFFFNSLEKEPILGGSFDMWMARAMVDKNGYQRSWVNKDHSAVEDEDFFSQAELEAECRRVDEAKRQRSFAQLIQEANAIDTSPDELSMEFFINLLKPDLTIGGISFNQWIESFGISKNDRYYGIDLLLRNHNSVAIISTKYKVSIEHVNQLQKLLQIYPQLAPHDRDLNLYGGIAGFSIPSDVTQLAHDKGLFVLKRKGHALVSDTSAMRPQ